MNHSVLLEAISFASRKHLGQMRKDKATPYFAHPMRVMAILSHVFGVKDTETLAAAVLHDTIEDTPTDRDDLSRRFGERVADYVVALTDDKRLPEAERLKLYHDELARAPTAVKLCKLGDMLDNLGDCRHISASFRAKTAARSRDLLMKLKDGIPGEWSHALQAVEEAIRSLEECS